MDYSDYPATAAEDIIRLRRRIASSQIPRKIYDHNLIIGSWNIRTFGNIYKEWTENPNSPKRNMRGMAYIFEIIKRFDVIAIQEVRSNTTAFRYLQNEFLGDDWGVILSDTTAGSNSERLAYIYDKRRIKPTGLAGEIVIPPNEDGNPQEQFDRTPYIGGFQAKEEQFSLLTAHIKYGDSASDRVPEIQSLSDYIVDELYERSKSSGEEKNLIVLGDFNIDTRGDNPLFNAFVSSGLYVPDALLNLKTTFNTDPKHYDQIAWFRDDLDLLYRGRAGVIDFAGSVYQNLSMNSMSFRVSDHYPLWVEFIIDRSVEKIGKKLGINADNLAGFAAIPD